MSYLIASFYHFAEFHDFGLHQTPLKDVCDSLEMKGTILLSHEGINATISGKIDDVESFFDYLKKDDRFRDVTYKENWADYKPFQKMKVRLKEEIVRLMDDDLLSLDLKKRGWYIDPEDWDDFLISDDVKVIDARNNYETKIGSFIGAEIPDTENFRDFPEWADKWKKHNKNSEQKIAMYCTGGIRCEKSTAYMKKIGYKNVYHLYGGILKYLEETKNESKNWMGDCFVFDDRVALDDELKPSDKIKCVKCNDFATTDDLKSVPKGRVICIRCRNNT